MNSVFCKDYVRLPLIAKMDEYTQQVNIERLMIVSGETAKELMKEKQITSLKKL